MRACTISLTAIFLSACVSQTPVSDTMVAQAGPATLAPPPPAAGVATDATRTANAALAARLSLDEPGDAEDAGRGRIAFIDAPAILNAEGGVVWSIPQFDFLKDEAPDTVNPSLWRQSRLAAEHGLFEVGPGIWQVRGYDLSVMSVIEGKTGWIIIDPLTSVETASAALKLVNDTLGQRHVTGLIYTHSHADHFGGARGVITEEDAALRKVPILAPIGFLEHAVSENLIAGNQMSRRSTFMFGNTIARSPTAHVGSGLGPGLPLGTISLIAPTEEIAGRGTQRVVDGVTIEFIDAAGTEAPAEFMFYLPESRALCTAEVVTATFHNLLTPRGAKVRDALAWSRVIDHVLETYGDKSDVVFASHHWPTWGQENVESLLAQQRDIYRYVHDQTLRNANAGATMFEAAEAVEEPGFQSEPDAFNTRGYYGTLNHNSKAVYQYYFGWWGGVPATYNALPHVVTASRYVDAMGGADATLALGAEAFEAGDFRWAAEVFNHVVFAGPDNETARKWLAATYEQLGFQAESGAWRSYYLVGASELRNGIPTLGNPQLGNPEFLRAVASIDLMDSLAARFNPAKMTGDPFSVNLVFPDRDEALTLQVGKSVIVPRIGASDPAAATLTIDRSAFDLVLIGEVTLLQQLGSGMARVDGDRSALGALFGALDQPDFWFPVVTQ